MTQATGWKERWDRVKNRAATLGYRHMEAMQLIELPWNKAGFRNAFFLGLPSRWNPFQSAVFYVRGIDEILTPTEVEFVLGHEAAHGMTRHAVKRMNLGMGLFLFFAISQVMALMIKAPALSLVLAVVIFAWAYHLMTKQGELQEFEADIMAVNILGGSPEAVEGAEERCGNGPVQPADHPAPHGKTHCLYQGELRRGETIDSARPPRRRPGRSACGLRGYATFLLLVLG